MYDCAKELGYYKISISCLHNIETIYIVGKLTQKKNICTKGHNIGHFCLIISYCVSIAGPMLDLCLLCYTLYQTCTRRLYTSIVDVSDVYQETLYVYSRCIRRVPGDFIRL